MDLHFIDGVLIGVSVSPNLARLARLLGVGVTPIPLMISQISIFGIFARHTKSKIPTEKLLNF